MPQGQHERQSHVSKSEQVTLLIMETIFVWYSLLITSGSVGHIRADRWNVFTDDMPRKLSMACRGQRRGWRESRTQAESSLIRQIFIWLMIHFRQRGDGAVNQVNQSTLPTEHIYDTKTDWRNVLWLLYFAFQSVYFHCYFSKVIESVLLLPPWWLINTSLSPSGLGRLLSPASSPQHDLRPDQLLTCGQALTPCTLRDCHSHLGQVTLSIVILSQMN